MRTGVLYYIGFYDVLRDGAAQRQYSLAAAKKMNYICSVLKELGNDVNIISPAYFNGRERVYIKGVREQIAPGVILWLPASWGANNKLLRIARVLWSRIWLFAVLMKNCRRDDRVLVYHNYEIALPVLLARFLKRFKLILEVEEQYARIWHLSAFERWKEKRLLRHAKNEALVVSEVLAKDLGVVSPIVSYGSYSAYQGDIPDKNFDGEITLVYTGSIDTVKNSAFLAVETMRYLPERYMLKLSGPIEKGKEQDFRASIEITNKQLGRQACEYVGVLNDEDYSRLLRNAHIALNPQQEGSYGAFLFPSKILTYLSYGLPVVSTKGASIVNSAVADIITFADGFRAEDVAKAVLSVHKADTELYLQRLQGLSQGFKRQLAKVFNMRDGF